MLLHNRKKVDSHQNDSRFNRAFWLIGAFLLCVAIYVILIIWILGLLQVSDMDKSVRQCRTFLHGTVRSVTCDQSRAGMVKSQTGDAGANRVFS